MNAVSMVYIAIVVTTAVLIMIKSLNLIAISWLMVFAPVWGSIGFAIIVGIFLYFLLTV